MTHTDKKFVPLTVMVLEIKAKRKDVVNFQMHKTPIVSFYKRLVCFLKMRILLDGAGEVK